MEPQQSQIQTTKHKQQATTDDHHHQDGGNSGKSVANNNYLCRQSSTRWTPTTDQIKILKDLYYNSGVRSPSTDQIQKISAKLRQFGKIEGKNVFYWFQNHKARERQKKRFTTSNPIYPNFPPAGISCPSSGSGMVGGCGYGHMSMESGLRDYGNGGICSYPTQGFQWSGVNPYPQSYSMMGSTRNDQFVDNQVQLLDEDEEKGPELETLPLFPIHTEDSNLYGNSNMMRSEPAENYYTSSCHWFNSADNVSSSRASLELRLNSYGDQYF